MASYTVSAGHRGVYGMTGAASTEDTVTFSRDLTQSVFDSGTGTRTAALVGVKVTSGGPVYFTVDNSAASVPSAGVSSTCYEVPSGERISVPPRMVGNTVVRLNFASSTVYSVSEES